LNTRTETTSRQSVDSRLGHWTVDTKFYSDRLDYLSECWRTWLDDV